MSETSVKIIKNEIRCRDDTVPKTVDTRSHCKVGLRACNNLPQPPPYILAFWGCGRLLHALNPTLQWLLVSTVFGTVSSLHLMIFTLVGDTTSSNNNAASVVGGVLTLVIGVVSALIIFLLILKNWSLTSTLQ